MSTEAPTTQDATGRFVADIEALIAAGDWQRAYETANRALSRGLRHPVFFMVRAQRMEETGHFQFALEDYQRAAAVAPEDARVHQAVGICASKLENYALAVESFRRAIALDPSNAELHYRLGVSIAHVGDHEAAEKSHEKAVELEPDYADALASLASINARKGNPELARAFAKRSLASNPGQPTALMSLAQADMAEHLYTDAEAKLVALEQSGYLHPFGRPQTISLLGDALDAQGKYPQAFAAYSRANAESQRLYASKFGGNRGLESARHLIAYFENEPAQRWLSPDDGGAFPEAFDTHVFLLGFMRSGTTLLEQVLASSPEIVALEEKGLLIGTADEFLTSVPALEKFAGLGSADLTKLRQDYWRRVREHLPNSTARIFVDKQPLNTTRLPLIAKLFPRARIIFALRDPRDVVFSCFRRHLRITTTQYEFLSLENCARIYALIMRIGELSRQKFPLNLLEHRYEAMVEDFETRIRAVCDFIGVEWSDAMLRFDKNRLVADLRSPSALQVRRPLYGEGIGQWRRYGDQLRPVLPILEPWVEKFGYPRD